LRIVVIGQAAFGQDVFLKLREAGEEVAYRDFAELCNFSHGNPRPWLER